MPPYTICERAEKLPHASRAFCCVRLCSLSRVPAQRIYLSDADWIEA